MKLKLILSYIWLFCFAVSLFIFMKSYFVAIENQIPNYPIIARANLSNISINFSESLNFSSKIIP